MRYLKGFTLVELLVAIAIIAVLSSVGFTIFSGSRNKANDAKRKADVAAIATAAELHFNRSTGTYPTAIDDSWFASGRQPQTPEGGNYSYVVSTGNTGFQVCATGTTICKESVQGQYIAAASSAPSSFPSSSPTSASTSSPTASSTAPPGTCPSSGLVAYWKMDEASGTTVNDSQGTKYGTVFGGASIVPGKINNARSFDGSSGLISFSNIMVSTLPVTLSLWVKPRQAAPVGIFDSAQYTQNAFRNYPYGNVEWWNASPNVPLGLSGDVWAYLVFVARYDSGTGTRYVDYYKDGALITTVSSSGSSTLPWSNFNLGGINGGSAGWYWGLLDEVGIWSRALSSAEVATLYNGGAGITCP